MIGKHYLRIGRYGGLMSMRPWTYGFDSASELWSNDIRGPWGLKLPDICLTGEEKPRKNLTQETCPDRGSNPDPLRDRRACYHLSHSGGHKECSPKVLSFFMTMLGRILQLQQRGSWSVFDGKCLITHHHPPGLGTLWFSALSSYETVVGEQHFGTMSWRPT